MNISNLLVTQDGFRKPQTLVGMIDYVRSGGRFALNNLTEHSGKEKPPLIRLVRFEDGLTYIHDGHHRTAAIWLSQHRDHLHEDEYQIQDVTYDYYMEIVFEVGWVTPYNPRTHVRFPNFCPFKREAMEIFSRYGEEAAIEFVVNNPHLYLMPRTERHKQITGILPDECKHLQFSS